jgi:magnesium transporter
VFNELARRDFPFLEENYQIYFQDTYNRMIRVFDVIDTAREIISGAMDIYQSTVSIRLNDIMKVLTIFATILGILTVITGFYGMNFVYIPGLRSRSALSGVVLIMTVTALGMLAWFKRKKWL